MDPVVLTTLITAVTAAIVAVIVAIGNLVVQIRTKQEIVKVHQATNSMKDELVESVTAASLKKGFREALDVVMAQVKAGVPIEQLSKANEIAAASERYDVEAADGKARNKAAAKE